MSTVLGTFLMRQFVVSQPGEFAEAARIDGANVFQVFILGFPRLREGDRADLIWMDRVPRVDISSLRELNGVVLDGVLLEERSRQPASVR